MATLTAQKSVEAGTTITLASAAGGGDEFVNTGVEFLLVDNQHGSASYNVTITAQVTQIHHQNYGKVTKSNVVRSVAAGNKAIIGPFKQNAFNDTNNKVQITYSAVTDLKVAVIYLDQQTTLQTLIF